MISALQKKNHKSSCNDKQLVLNIFIVFLTKSQIYFQPCLILQCIAITQKDLFQHLVPLHTGSVLICTVQKVQKLRSVIFHIVPSAMLYMLETIQKHGFQLKVEPKSKKCRKSPTLLSDNVQKILSRQQCGKFKLTFSIGLHIILHCCIGFEFFQVLPNFINLFIQVPK